MDRRKFILTGIAAGAAVSLSSGVALWAWQQSLQPDNGNRDLVLSALLPALLYGALPQDATLAAAELERSKTAVIDFLPFLSKRQQTELNQLFNLLANRLSFLGLSGHITALPQLSPAARLQLLNQWRDSYVEVLQQAYHGLRELLLGAYYGQSEHWQALNYSAPVFR